jgi:hypothetical protein
MKFSFLIPFLLLLCNCQFWRLNSVRFLCYQVHILAGWHLKILLSLSLMLQPTVSRPVCLGIKHPSGLMTRFLLPYGIRRTVAGLLIWGALSDERMGLSFTLASGPSQRSHSRVRVPWDLRPSKFDWTQLNSFITTLHGPHREHRLYVVQKGCL